MYPPHVVKPRRWRPAAWLIFKFGFVGGLGLFLNVYIMYVLTQITALTGLLAGFLGGSSYLVYAIISSQAAVLVNFLMNDALVFRGRVRATGLIRRFTFFNSIASADLLLRLPILWGFTTFLSITPLLSNSGRVTATSSRLVSSNRSCDQKFRLCSVFSDETVNWMRKVEVWLKLQVEQFSRRGLLEHFSLLLNEVTYQ